MTTATVAQILAVATPQVSSDEGCELKAYQDTLGKWTIGYGRCDSGVTSGMVCTPSQAALWRDQKLAALCGDLDFHLPWWRSLGAVRAAVVLNLAYQLGVGGVMQFHDMLDALRAGNWNAAGAALLDSLLAKQTSARAQREATQLETGIAA